MKRYLGLALTLLIGGCSTEAAVPPGPYDELPLGSELRLDGLQGPVHVARDTYGIAHIHAEEAQDLYFAQGFVTAHDRLPQMDILRRLGAGTLSELFGALEPSVIESDLEMRAHRMRPLAQAALAELRASDDPVDAEIVDALEAYAAGVNAYAAALEAGDYELDPAVALSFDVSRFVPWDPVDSLVLGRFKAFALSWTTPVEIDLTAIYQSALDTFGPEVAADLVRLEPIDHIATVDGFPNVEQDTGSRSNRRADRSGPRRPQVPAALLRAARRTLSAPGAALDARTFQIPRAGSNAWAVGPQHTGGGAILAGDQHLNLPNPSLFYPVHLVQAGELDVEGVTFPGVPGVVLGHNGELAWTSTVVLHDVNDVYLEEIERCDGGDGDCVRFGGAQVPIEAWTEDIDIGVFGTITQTRTATYERVPHHGYIIPEIDGGEVIPRTSSKALSVRYTGHAVTQEIRAFWRLSRAQTVAEAFSAVDDFTYGGQNFLFIDTGGDIGWTTHARVPLRDPAAYSWHPDDDPEGLAPFFVLPGDGSAEWDGDMDPRYIPHAVNPDKGYLVTANSDPVGATFDGDPLDGPVVDGRPLFVGAVYMVGLRTGRITRLLEELIETGDPITVEDMAAMQADSRSNYGARMRDPLLAALESADVVDWLAEQPAGRAARIEAAREHLSAWQFDTGPDSVATSIFNAWVHFAIGAVLGDEMTRLDWDVYDTTDEQTARVLLALFEQPDSLRTGEALCDDVDTAGVVESCGLQAVRALDQAIDWLASADGFGTADPDAWRWGELHTLTLEPLFPADELNLPPRDERDGFPRAGDNFCVDAANPGYHDLDFRQAGHGAAQRFLAQVEEDGIRARLAIPGGTIYHRDSPHYRDLLDAYYLPGTHFEMPFSTEEIIADGQERWLLRP